MLDLPLPPQLQNFLDREIKPRLFPDNSIVYTAPNGGLTVPQFLRGSRPLTELQTAIGRELTPQERQKLVTKNSYYLYCRCPWTWSFYFGNDGRRFSFQVERTGRIVEISLTEPELCQHSN